MAYIANKPVRFDRNYAIGEVIPDRVIDPKMEKRLIAWGKIIYIKYSDNEKINIAETEESTINKQETDVQEYIQAESENTAECKDKALAETTVKSNKSNKRNAAKKE